MGIKINISVIVPVYGCSSCLHELVERVSNTVQKLDKSFEIILVDDCGPDNSWETMQNISASNPMIKSIRLSRNFGQHYSIHAGLEQSIGDWVVVMDCDLQDKPEEIENLFKKSQEGFDIVLAQRLTRNDSFFKRMSSKLFYKVFGYLTDTEQDSSIANFGIYHRNVIDAILSMKDYIRYFPTMVQWVGFSKTKLEVKHQEREEGDSGYSFKALLNLAFNNIIAFSDKPLRLAVKFGIFIALLAGLLGGFYLYKYIIGDIQVLGFSSLIISIWFLSGVTISILGLIGMYIGKVFEKVKSRPLYIIDKKINFDE